MLDPKIERTSLASLKPHANNARSHSARQIEQIAASIRRFGFTNPILVGDDLTIIAGHGRFAAAKLLGMTEAPIIRLSHLNADERRAYVLADNRLAEKAGWDREILAIELQWLTEAKFDTHAVGFETPEVDMILEAAAEGDPNGRDDADIVPASGGEPRSKPGDLWLCGRHRLLCADAREGHAYRRLMTDAAADVVFTDPPYNVPIDGFVGGKGQVRHREFAMGAGEMSGAEFQRFLQASLGAAAAACRPGAIALVCMDWRHAAELLSAGRTVFAELKNICVWNKTNGGMGSLYRSQHEFVFVFKAGDAPHENNIELGRHGRNRTNVWSYPGVNTFREGRDAELAMHPTVKPVALVADAIKDVSRRGGVVLDPFGGSGSTLIAAEQCGRAARLI
ncbi:MAG: site-specific DNA-methyltransferase, partial [Hyphomonadaceae bacterium]